MTAPTARTFPRAFLALWNSISSPRLAPEYETWHTFEHVPERVGLPGFMEARRYRSVEQPANYFTCYRLYSLEALATPAYRDVVAHPTPWSARMRGELRDFLRLPCELAGVHGNSSASRLATLHLRLAANGSGASLDAILKQRVEQAGLVCAHWGWASPGDDFPLANVVPSSPGEGRDIVLMLQHFDLQALRQQTQTLLQSVQAVATLATAPAFFELLSQVRQGELSGPLSHRQAARPELLQSFLQGDKP